MHTSEQRPVGSDSPETRHATGESPQADRPDGSRATAGRRLWMASARLVGCVARFALYLRISQRSPRNSDEANIALQGLDLIHGHLLLHGWILSDAAFYTLEIPLYGLTGLLFGVRDLTLNVAAALWY